MPVFFFVPCRTYIICVEHDTKSNRIGKAGTKPNYIGKSDTKPNHVGEVGTKSNPCRYDMIQSRIHVDST